MAPGEDELPKDLVEPIALATVLLFKPTDSNPPPTSDAPDKVAEGTLDLLRHTSSGDLSNTVNEVCFFHLISCMQLKYANAGVTGTF